MKQALLLFLLLTSAVSLCHAQFNLEAYRDFLAKHKDMSSDDLLQMYPAGRFTAEARTKFIDAQYAGEIRDKYQFTPYEEELINKYGFMVSERLSFPSFQAAFYDIYQKDLPVYISSDAILHALHRSYSSMLKAFEYELLKPKVNSALADLKSYIENNKSKYSDAQMLQSMKDADLYVSVALLLINGDYPPYKESYKPVFEENAKEIIDILVAIEEQQMGRYPLFAKTERMVDWSQFTVRGHYTESETLGAYFKALMWLGRTELYITAPKAEPAPSAEDVQRQIRLSALLCQGLDATGAIKKLDVVEQVLRTFVGKQDNLTSATLLNTMKKLGISDATSLTDPKVAESLQKTLEADPEAQQNILSQVLFGGGDKPIQPAIAYMLIGQRFIIDSYILGNVVYDKITFKGSPVRRMMPNPLDVLFAFGNDASAQLLTHQLEQHPYSSNLAALRYLIGTVSEESWQSSYYSEWLSAIRTLNPPDEEERKELPRYMQTGAWWQKQMNTQLASWTELRHDNLLYGKQSYTGGVTCYYPGGYVEPVPALFDRVAAFSRRVQSWADDFLKDVEVNPYSRLYQLKTQGFKAYDVVCSTLGNIARKELKGESLSADEQSMLDNWLFTKHKQEGCESFEEFNGWYQKLLFGVEAKVRGAEKGDFVIADVHTQATDEDGNMVGRVLHVATGKINLLTVVGEDKDCSTAYIGPVASYYENVSDNFKRFTDEEWQQLYKENPIARPRWTAVYMAGDDGGSKGETQSLLLSVENTTPSSDEFSLSAPVPNPFSQSSIISFEVPPQLHGALVSVSIYTTNGELVQTLLNRKLEAGAHTLRWNGTYQNGDNAASGVYICKVSIGRSSKSVNLNIVR